MSTLEPMPTQDRVIIGFPLYSKARKENPSKNDEKSTFPNSFQSDQGQPLRLPAPLRDPYPSARARRTPLVLPSLPRCPACRGASAPLPRLGGKHQSREQSLRGWKILKMTNIFFVTSFYFHPAPIPLSSCALATSKALSGLPE